MSFKVGDRVVDGDGDSGVVAGVASGIVKVRYDHPPNECGRLVYWVDESFLKVTLPLPDYSLAHAEYAAAFPDLAAVMDIEDVSPVDKETPKAD